MSLTSTPSGIQPVYHPSGQVPTMAHNNVLLSGTNVAIYKYQPVFITIGTGAAVNGVTVAAGQVVLQPITAISQAVWGVFAGCEYRDASNTPVESNFWPASTAVFTGSTVTAWLFEDPAIVYSIQGDAAINPASPGGAPFSAVDGRQGDFSNFAAGSTSTGLSQCTMSATLRATTVQGQLQIVTLDPTVFNQSPADAFPQFQVRIARPQNAAAFPSF